MERALPIGPGLVGPPAIDSSANSNSHAVVEVDDLGFPIESEKESEKAKGADA